MRRALWHAVAIALALMAVWSLCFIDRDPAPATTRPLNWQPIPKD